MGLCVFFKEKATRNLGLHYSGGLLLSFTMTLVFLVITGAGTSNEVAASKDPIISL